MVPARVPDKLWPAPCLTHFLIFTNEKMNLWFSNFVAKKVFAPDIPQQHYRVMRSTRCIYHMYYVPMNTHKSLDPTNFTFWLVFFLENWFSKCCSNKNLRPLIFYRKTHLRTLVFVEKVFVPLFSCKKKTSLPFSPVDGPGPGTQYS